jgi:hypothetical protein
MNRLANKAGLPTADTAANSGHGKVDHNNVPINEEEANAGAPYGNTSGFHDRAFDHPALWKPQPVVWITDDPLGVGKFEVERIRKENVDASCEYTGMENDGKLKVQRSPPDQTWWDGMTA